MMAQPSEPAGFERILEFLRQARGVDFTAYKSTSLIRRIRTRMQMIDIPDFDAYLDFLQVHPDEFVSLFNTILINVTSFFRDTEVWETLRHTVLPDIAAAHNGDGPIRVWSAGSASGQEAYSVAMLLAELLGMDSFRERVKIYATDVDDEALAESRRAVYDAKHVAEVPRELLDKYFERSSNELYSFNRDLRRSVIFGRHDLIQDAPISRVDLLLCRNTLMYFNSEAQSQIVGRFYFSTNPGGYLVLGRAEMLSSHTAMFQAVDLKRRIFKSLRKTKRDRLLLQPGREDTVTPPSNYTRLRDAAFEVSADAQIIIDPAATLIAANAAARRQFNIGDGDLGSALQNLEVSYRPGEMRPAIDRARAERRDITMRGIPWDHAGANRFFDIVVAPLFDDDRGLLGIRVTFYDVTPLKTLQEELTHTKQDLATAYEELQSTNEELETTNEELQSTVEELETTNEELQSTNEELETMNEELHSANEELQTMNDELRNRGTELNASNAFLEAVFTGLRSAVVVLDRDLRVHVWNAGALDAWGLRADEAQGTSFFTLDIGLPVGELHQPIRDILSGAAPHRELTLDATNRKGKKVRCRVAIAPLLGGDRAVTGAILLMADETADG
jgi:two-component system, chemotaxis family, CheB/CheR fusion protein